jgi:signal transduction histidine kinase
LGLSISLAVGYDIIVQEHRGDIKVEMQEGKFTAFKISLPQGGTK